MMLLSGCKSKHSDYTTSSGLSSSAVVSDRETFLSAPNLYIKLYGKLSGPKQKVGDFSKFWRQLTGERESFVYYYFQVCSKEEPQQPQRCINPFMDWKDRGLWFTSNGIFSILHSDRLYKAYPGSTPYIEYIEKGKDGKFKTVSYFNFDKAKVKDTEMFEGHYIYLRPKEEYLQSPGIGKTLKPLPPYEITARDLMKLAVEIDQLLIFPNIVSFGYTVTWVCHPHPSINCTREIEHEYGTNTKRHDWEEVNKERLENWNR